MSAQPSVPEEPAPETILCDTSFVSVVQSHGALATWPAGTRTRLDAAVLAINVVTLAELRDGHIYAGWGANRRARAEQLMASYLWVPLDMATVDECARLRAACRSAGVTVPDNDIWIAATANTRGRSSRATSTSTRSPTWTTSCSTRPEREV